MMLGEQLPRMFGEPQHDGVVYGISPLIRLWSASIRVRINPSSCLAAISTDPLACGSWAAGLSATTWGISDRCLS
eukprot:2043078-Alexandrium_andersonii.AAC.1